jgi:hypothetical protein
VQRQRSPIAHLRRMGLRLGLPAEPDDATSQGLSRHLTHTGLVEEEKSIPSAVEEATGRGDRILAGSRGESNVVQHYDGLGQPIFPQFLARALSPSRSFEALPRVQKVIAFVHRLLTAPAEAPQAQGLMPLTISTAATDVHPRVAMEGAASTVIGRVGPGGTEESIEPLLVGTVSGRDVAPGRPSTISGGRQFTAWLHGRRYAVGRVSSSEQMDEATKEDVQAGLPGSLHAGSQFIDAKMMSPSPEFVFPSLPIVQPASPEEDLTLQALQPVASHDLVLPHHRQPPLEQRAPVLGPLSHTEPTTTIMGVEPSAPTSSGGPSNAGAGLGLALAPLERPRGPAEPSGAAESVTAGAAGGQEATEEAAEANLERLARDVYAVLRRRLAWEKERNMVLIS